MSNELTQFYGVENILFKKITKIRATILKQIDKETKLKTTKAKINAIEKALELLVELKNLSTELLTKQSVLYNLKNLEERLLTRYDELTQSRSKIATARKPASPIGIPPTTRFGSEPQAPTTRLGSEPQADRIYDEKNAEINLKLKKLREDILKKLQKPSSPLGGASETSVRQTGGGIYDVGKALIYGIKDYSPDQKKIIEKYGANAITSIKIGRSPIPSAINAILNIVTLGAFQKLLKQSPYDKLVHLFSIITLDNGIKILLEKNERINIKVVSSYNPKNSEYVDATYIPSGLTFKELLDNGKKVLGNKYFKYDAIQANCQDYIIGILKGSSILNDNLQQFIKQDVETIFKTLPITKKIMNTVTGTGAVVDVIKKGGATPTDQKLYEEVKTDMDNIYDKPSAYRSGAIVKEYKNRGGTYIEDNKSKNLERWFKEKWKNINPIVSDDKDMYPTYRPTKRISDKTPTLLQDIPIDRLKEQIKLKQIYKGDKNLPPFITHLYP
jgi:hypothetical protein